MKDMPTNSLIENYLPADYIDTFSREITLKQAMTPSEFRKRAFSQLP